MLKKLKIILLSILFIPVFALPISSQKYENNVVLTRNLHRNTIESDDFISYWKDDFRKDEEGNIISICDITLASYKEMYGKYVVLSDESRSEVDITPDYEEGYTIKDSIKELVNRFENASKEENKKPALKNSTTIIIVVVVAVFGMSVICVFFALKSGKIIK